MSRLTFTPRERLQMRGYCTEPEDGLGTVTLDHNDAPVRQIGWGQNRS